MATSLYKNKLTGQRKIRPMVDHHSAWSASVSHFVVEIIQHNLSPSPNTQFTAHVQRRNTKELRCLLTYLCSEQIWTVCRRNSNLYELRKNSQDDVSLQSTLTHWLSKLALQRHPVITSVVEPPWRSNPEAARHFELGLALFCFVYRYLRFLRIYLLCYED